MLFLKKEVNATKESGIETLMMSILPKWHYRIAKPFKQLFYDGITPEMYFCTLTLIASGDALSMSEFAKRTKMSKQQMTKMVNKLIEVDFVKRLQIPDDRRIIKLAVTDKALAYIKNFSRQNNIYYSELLNSLSDKDKNDFIYSLETLNKIFDKMPCE